MLVDGSTGEVVSVVKDNVDLPDSPLSSTPIKRRKCPEDDKRGGAVAHAVDGIVAGIHPRHEDESEDLTNPDWSGDTSTEGLLYLNLHAKVPLPPLVTAATPDKAPTAAANDEEGLFRKRTASAETVSTIATFRTGLESVYQAMPETADNVQAEAPSTLHYKETSDASHTTARPGKEDSSDAVLLEFLGGNSVLRLSRIRKPSGQSGGSGVVARGASTSGLKPVKLADIPSLWSYIPSAADLWASIASFASWSWLSVPQTDIAKADAADARRRRDQLNRLSVVYVDTASMASWMSNGHSLIR